MARRARNFSDFFQSFRDGKWQHAGAVPAEFVINFLKAMNQVCHFSPRKRAAGGGAKMRAATERPAGVDEAISASRLEHRARPIADIGQTFPARGAEGPGGDRGFALGQIRCAPGELEVATFLASQAIAFDRARVQFCVNSADGGEGGLGVQASLHFANGASAMAWPAIHPVAQAA